MMMALGRFVFSLATLAYQALQHQSTWRHPTTARIGARPATQFIGPGEDTITLTGLLAPEVTGQRVSLRLLRDMAHTGKAYVLVDGAGVVYGSFVIEALTEQQTLFYPNGVPRRIEFTINLKRVEERPG